MQPDIDPEQKAARRALVVRHGDRHTNNLRDRKRRRELKAEKTARAVETQATREPPPVALSDALSGPRTEFDEIQSLAMDRLDVADVEEGRADG